MKITTLAVDADELTVTVHADEEAAIEALVENFLKDEDLGGMSPVEYATERARLVVYIEEHEVPDPVEEWIARKPDGIEGITILVEPDPAVETRLEEFEIRQSEDDPEKTDLEFIHDPCGEHLCDVQDDDTLRVLHSVARSHRCKS